MVIPAPAGELLKIMDFGVAKVRDEGGAGATETATSVGGAIGTLGYMAPETFAGGPVDARADLFAVGVMIAESLTGVRPFGGRTPQEMIATLLHSTYHLPGESAELRGLDEVLQRCLAKEPRHRLRIGRGCGDRPVSGAGALCRRRVDAGSCRAAEPGR